MKKYLLLLSVLGMSVAQTSIASIEISNKTLTSNKANISNSYGSSQKFYSTNNNEIDEAINALTVRAKEKEEKLAELTKRLESDRQLKQAELAEQQRELAKKPDARIGMTKNQILNKSNWGEPDNINTTIDAYGTFEQWIYGGGQYLYFKNGKLTTIQY